MTDEITITITSSQAGELVKAIAFLLEYQKHAVSDFDMSRVAEQIIEKSREAFGWTEQKCPDNYLERLRYPIKKISVTFYETNPKKLPEGAKS